MLWLDWAGGGCETSDSHNFRSQLPGVSLVSADQFSIRSPGGESQPLSHVSRVSPKLPWCLKFNFIDDLQHLPLLSAFDCKKHWERGCCPLSRTDSSKISLLLWFCVSMTMTMVSPDTEQTQLSLSGVTISDADTTYLSWQLTTNFLQQQQHSHYSLKYFLVSETLRPGQCKYDSQSYLCLTVTVSQQRSKLLIFTFHLPLTIMIWQVWVEMTLIWPQHCCKHSQCCPDFSDSQFLSGLLNSLYCWFSLMLESLYQWHWPLSLTTLMVMMMMMWSLTQMVSAPVSQVYWRLSTGYWLMVVAHLHHQRSHTLTSASNSINMSFQLIKLF